MTEYLKDNQDNLDIYIVCQTNSKNRMVSYQGKWKTQILKNLEKRVREAAKKVIIGQKKWGHLCKTRNYGNRFIKEKQSKSLIVDKLYRNKKNKHKMGKQI